MRRISGIQEYIWLYSRKKVFWVESGSKKVLSFNLREGMVFVFAVAKLKFIMSKLKGNRLGKFTLKLEESKE